jgi:predicted GTPase
MMVDKLKKYEEIEKKYGLESEFEDLKKEYAVTKSSEFQKALKEISEKGRNLKIGVVGRVKAGKSSLLNSLFFDGESILPKAATPMTAALSVLEYGDRFEAEIELFEDRDIEELREKYFRYKELLNERVEAELEELLEKKIRKNKAFDKEELREKVLKRVKKDMPEDLVSAYEQYEMIKNSNVQNIPTKIEAKSYEELKGKLEEYVGAEGRYMPFTKAVRIKIKNEMLEGLSVVDTPGVNDPVVSREDRTRELLKYCDVILILSPAGQFMSEEDLGLVDRIASKEGLREVYLIASQIDSQLFGSEKRDDLYKAVNDIEKKLTSHAVEVFEGDDFLKVSPVFAYLKKNGVIGSSAVAYSIYKKFDKGDFDSNEAFVLENLEYHYPAYFKENAKENLLKLSQIPRIKKLIEEVRGKKEIIIKEKIENFEKSKSEKFEEFKQKAAERIQSKITQLKNSDIEEIKKKKKKLLEMKNKATSVANDTFEDLVSKLDLDIRNTLIDKLNEYFNKANREIRESEDTETRTWEEEYTVDKGSGFLWWRDIFGTRYETRVRTRRETYTIVRAGIVRSALEELTDNVENVISLKAREYIYKWRKDVFKELVGALRDEVGDENLEVSTLSSVIRRVVNLVELPDITYSNDLPYSLRKSGTLKKSEAESFLRDARDYVSNLKSRVKSDIDSYVNSLTSKLNSINIGNEIFKSYGKEIAKLEKELNEKDISIKRYEEILKELRGV